MCWNLNYKIFFILFPEIFIDIHIFFACLNIGSFLRFQSFYWKLLFSHFRLFYPNFSRFDWFEIIFFFSLAVLFIPLFCRFHLNILSVLVLQWNYAERIRRNCYDKIYKYGMHFHFSFFFFRLTEELNNEITEYCR